MCWITKIGNLIAHAGGQREPPIVPKFRFEHPFEDIEDVPAITPMICKIVLRIFDMTDTNITHRRCAPIRPSCLTWMLRDLYAVPVDDGKRMGREFHMGDANFRTCQFG